jgi:apolipoprotein N-acyltransferase
MHRIGVLLIILGMYVARHWILLVLALILGWGVWGLFAVLNSEAQFGNVIFVGLMLLTALFVIALCLVCAVLTERFHDYFFKGWG